jgi:hypothetical protein
MTKKILPQTRELARFEQYVRANQPCILDLPLGADGLARLRDDVWSILDGDTELSVLLGDTCEIASVHAREFRQDFDDAGANQLNLLQHYLSADQVAELFVPQILASTESNLCRMLDGTANPISLVASPLYTFTVPHIDSGAFGNWMVLVTGRKLWMLVSPDDEQVIYDPAKRVWAFGDETKTDIIHYGMLGPNQLLFAPPGWVHSVITLERSVGYGGQYIAASDFAQCKRITNAMLERGIENPEFAGFYDRLERDAKVAR